MADKKKDKKKSVGDNITEILKKIPVPIPGSAANVLELARERIAEANKKKKKKDDK